MSTSLSSPQPWQVRDRLFEWGKCTYIMGILNVTPDSFSDGGDFYGVENAIAQAQTLIDAGVDIIDIGGQSTRPGSEQISLTEECDRTLPIIHAIRQISEIPISIDTTRAAVAQAAVAAGADIVNDISGGTFDPQMLATVARLGVRAILMHIRGTPQTMQSLTEYDDLMGEIDQFLAERLQASEQAGIARSHLAIDPGIGFAKTYRQNLQLLRQLPAFQHFGVPILVGPSRKSFIGHILNQPNPKQRVWGTAAACTSAIAGGADILRVHDVPQMREVSRVADAIYRDREA
ncbi:dihydropteroate synthase [Desertifilum sp. FACHB-1129]|uniref:Dihydropteroate synthase n=1 Tax=Desertifilum tharense IPPAS B-1220 TaxID=1781255 RepID=A0A1E5QF73_9CYAN|nr:MULTISPECIES: dihydropteroate synthase [Desertifilum]MDA0213580.1 dihydropteroate synthase [Cyanobacteria bacterium FC1]MBD2315046.1 dihydropteroate synthase [Desertifilum sp. FACHB-1129]MBD2325184.1 dihydropteroate synthase [Desertifilum sp. FACHB-866]MBD2335266.1 dihydropteroate synthase [Desertifilum sp. FACHB-868]OEJ72983.1 dihydropteroate synthase [Desertifilum tharense IPPAS B-1220]